MHELTIATSLIDLASDYAARNGSARVTAMHVRLGVMCGVARSLYFCFAPATRGTLCEGAKLHIEEIPLTIFCDTCDAVKSPISPANLRCPGCGRPSRKVLSGREMELAHIEIEENPSGPVFAPGALALQ
jgi:hydrogenase nickel incorporation protein HypA/HybF